MEPQRTINLDAAADFAALVLVTARTIRELIDHPMRPESRARMLRDLDAALAPFDCEDAPNPRDDNCELPKTPEPSRG